MQVLLAFMVGMTNLYRSHGYETSETLDEQTAPSSESFKGFLYTIFLLCFIILLKLIPLINCVAVFLLRNQCKFFFDNSLSELELTLERSLCLQTAADDVHVVLFNLRPHTAGQTTRQQIQWR